MAKRGRGRPKNPEGPQVRWSVQLDPKYKPALMALAAANHRTARQEIERALELHLERERSGKGK